MANKTNYYYVLVFTDNGPKFVTNLLPKKWAEWSATEPPKEFTKQMATEIAQGLCLNFTYATVVNSWYKISGQPYNYDKGGFQWVNNSDVSRETI